MTVRELREVLSTFNDYSHVVIAVVPESQMIIPTRGCKLDLHDGWCDTAGVLNLIAVNEACEVDPNLREENGLGEI